MKAKVRQLRSKLKNTKKGTHTINEFVLHMKAICDSLVAIGDSISEKDQIDAILEGLPEEYGPFVMMIYGRSDSPSVSDIESSLLLQEAQLDKFKTELTTATISVNVGQTASDSNTFENRESGKTGIDTKNKGGHGWCDRGGRNCNNRGRGRYGNGPRPTFQLCFKYGHDAFNC